MIRSWDGDEHLPVLCRKCGREVEPGRECFAMPVCHICLPPPDPLPIDPAVLAEHGCKLNFGPMHRN